MSFMLTTEQIKNRSKTVTRRLGWRFLNPGDILNACEKCQGLKKGEKIKRICQIKVVSNRSQSLDLLLNDAFYNYAVEEMVKEGFQSISPSWFVEMFSRHNKCQPYEIINRIEFEYV